MIRDDKKDKQKSLMNKALEILQDTTINQIIAEGYTNNH